MERQRVLHGVLEVAGGEFDSHHIAQMLTWPNVLFALSRAPQWVLAAASGALARQTPQPGR
jgi:hypothetical protein